MKQLFELLDKLGIEYVLYEYDEDGKNDEIDILLNYWDCRLNNICINSVDSEEWYNVLQLMLNTED